MKKLCILICFCLLGCQPKFKTSAFMKTYFDHIHHCQIDDVIRLSRDISPYYHDCTRLLAFASENSRIVKEEKIGNGYFVYTEDQTSKEQVRWYLQDEGDRFLVLTFEKVINK